MCLSCVEVRGFGRTMSICGLAVLLASVLIVGNANAVVERNVDQEKDSLYCSPCSPDPRMRPTQDVYRGQPFVWQIPPQPVALLFVLHGGDADPFIFFDHGPGCEECYGRPEPRAMVMDALERGYAVIALKSIGVGWDSWPLETSKDIPIATALIREWTRQKSLENLPLVLWGNSDGGRFASSLSLVLSVQALVLTSASGELKVEQIATYGQFPPTIFAYFPNDYDPTVLMTRDVKRAITTLVQRGISVAELQLSPAPLSPHFFADRIRCVTEEISEAVYAAYKAARGWLDDNGYLLRNPYFEDWESILWEANILPACKVLGKNAGDVEMELSVAFGHHGFSTVRNDELFSWLNSKVLFTSLESPENKTLARKAGRGNPLRTPPEIMIPFSAS